MKLKKILVISLIMMVFGFDDGHNHDHGNETIVNKQTDDVAPEETKIGKDAQFLLDVETVMVKASNKSHVKQLNARVRSTTTGSSEINAPYKAVISKIYVNIGQTVKAGQTLASIRQNINAVDQLNISTKLNEIQALLSSSRKELERLKNIDDVVERKRITNLEIEINKLELQQSEYTNMVATGGRSLLLQAPISGKLNDFQITEGTQVNEGQRLFRIFNSNQVLVEAIVYDQSITNDQDSLSFTVTSLSGKQTVNTGVQMVSVSPDLDPHTQTTKITLSVDNTENRFKPGEAVMVGVSKFSSDKHITVPNDAIVTIEGKPVVFVHSEPEIFKTVYVNPGESDGSTTEIFDGIKSKDRVVVSGVYSVKSIYLSK